MIAGASSRVIGMTIRSTTTWRSGLIREAKGVRVMTDACGGGESLARYACAKGVAANTSFVWLPANEGTFWGGTMDDLQKW